MQHLEVSGAVRRLKWSLGVKWLNVCRNKKLKKKYMAQNFKADIVH